MIGESHFQKLKSQLSELEGRLSDPRTAANMKVYRDLMREYAAVKKQVEMAGDYFRIRRELEQHRALLADENVDKDLAALAREEIGQLEQAMPRAERQMMIALLPDDPSDSRNAIMEIRAGTGGDEAGLFAGDLFRMYSRYAEARGWKVGVIDTAPCDVGGFKEIVFSVEGTGVYKRLKFESGVHRVQRVPATEAAGRIHTSAATVAVFPEVDEQDEIDIKPEEIRIDLFCASGPGGQSVNTTYSAVRITHLATGLVAQSQDERSQHRNRDKAMGVLRSRVADHLRRMEEAKMGDARRNQIKSGDRSDRTRTYNFPQNRLTDHRINLTLYNLESIMEGDLDEVIDSLLGKDVETRLSKEFSAA